MRKLSIKKTIGILIVTMPVSGKIIAEDMSKYKLQSVPGQEQIVRMLEEDFNFESQRKQLSNQLALEKLRNELSKLRLDSHPEQQIAVSTSSDEKSDAISSVAVEAPAIVLISEVAGVSRILVNDAGNIKLRSPADKFIANNNRHYKFVTKEDKKFVLKEVQ